MESGSDDLATAGDGVAQQGFQHLDRSGAAEGADHEAEDEDAVVAELMPGELLGQPTSFFG